MPYAIHLFFEKLTENMIQSAWRNLAENGIAPYMQHSGNRPHLTLAIYQQLNLEACQQRLKTISAAYLPLPLSFQTIGIFPTTPATVFLGATVTTPLLEIHAHLHKILQPISSEPLSYYLPDRWIPHCTLALDLEPESIPSVLEISMSLPLPLKGTVAEIGAIEFRPVRQLFTFPLGGEKTTDHPV